MREPASATVETWFERVGLGALTLSRWTVTEFVSAIGIKVRARALTGVKGAAVIRQFHLLVRQSLRPIEPTTADFEKAAWLMERFDLGLRAGDALHVAIARTPMRSSLVTLDQPMARAAEKIGLACESPA